MAAILLFVGGAAMKCQVCSCFGRGAVAVHLLIDKCAFALARRLACQLPAAFASSVWFPLWLMPLPGAPVCPSPAVVADASCTVPPGTVITVTPSSAIGLNASGAS